MGEIYCDRNDRRQLIGDVECGGFWVRLPSHPVSPTTRKITPRPNQPHTGHTTNCYNVKLLVGSCVQIKPSHDSPDHLCLHPKQKHCKPSPTVIFLLLENIHSRVSFFRQFDRSVRLTCISKYVQTPPHAINVSK